MDAYLVQKHVADWINGGGIQGVDKIWAAQPTALGFPWGDYGGDGEYHCQGIVYVLDDSDTRRSMPIHKGIRWQTWDVRIEVCLHSTDPDWDAADQQLKGTIVDSIKNMIKLDPSMGTLKIQDKLFLQGGEGPRGIRTTYDLPFADENSGEREQWAIIRFTCASEVIG